MINVTISFNNVGAKPYFYRGERIINFLMLLLFVYAKYRNTQKMFKN